VSWLDFPELRGFTSAALYGITAAGVEITAWRGMGRVGYIAFQDDPLGAQPRVCFRHG
jgi:hypothetical protein